MADCSPSPRHLPYHLRHHVRATWPVRPGLRGPGPARSRAPRNAPQPPGRLGGDTCNLAGPQGALQPSDQGPRGLGAEPETKSQLTAYGSCALLPLPAKRLRGAAGDRPRGQGSPSRLRHRPAALLARGFRGQESGTVGFAARSTAGAGPTRSR